MSSTAAMLAAVVMALVVFSASAAKLPASFKRCKMGDPKLGDCLKGAVRTAVVEAAKGIPSLGVLSIDPLRVAAISIGQGSGPVAVSLDFKDIDIYGLSEVQVDSVSFDTKNFKIDGKVKTRKPVTLKGNYKAEGKVIVLPIKGEGKCELSLDDIDADVKIRGEKFVKGGETFMKITSFGFTFDTNRLRVNFENLFNGDKALGDNMNKFLNENWREILTELKPAVEATFGATFKEVTNRIFLKVPFNQLFSE